MAIPFIIVNLLGNIICFSFFNGNIYLISNLFISFIQRFRPIFNGDDLFLTLLFLRGAWTSSTSRNRFSHIFTMSFGSSLILTRSQLTLLRSWINKYGLYFILHFSTFNIVGVTFSCLKSSYPIN